MGRALVPLPSQSGFEPWPLNTTFNKLNSRPILLCNSHLTVCTFSLSTLYVLVNIYIWVLCYHSRFYCVFQKQATSKVQKPTDNYAFFLPSVKIMPTANIVSKSIYLSTIKLQQSWWSPQIIAELMVPTMKNGNKQKCIEIYKSQVNWCFLKGPLRWLTATNQFEKLLTWVEFAWGHMFLKGAITRVCNANENFKVKFFI